MHFFSDDQIPPIFFAKKSGAIFLWKKKWWCFIAKSNAFLKFYYFKQNQMRLLILSLKQKRFCRLIGKIPGGYACVCTCVRRALVRAYVRVSRAYACAHVRMQVRTHAHTHVHTHAYAQYARPNLRAYVQYLNMFFSSSKTKNKMYVPWEHQLFGRKKLMWKRCNGDI